MTRQNYYKQRRGRPGRQVDEDLVVNLVCQERMLQPRLGGRKLLHLVQGELAQAGVALGRDRFFALLRRRHLLIPRPVGGVRTTDSRHSFAVYGNRLKDLT